MFDVSHRLFFLTNPFSFWAAPLFAALPYTRGRTLARSGFPPPLDLNLALTPSSFVFFLREDTVDVEDSVLFGSPKNGRLTVPPAHFLPALFFPSPPFLFRVDPFLPSLGDGVFCSFTGWLKVICLTFPRSFFSPVIPLSFPACPFLV